MSKKINFVGLTTKWPHFEYECFPICGIGKNRTPIISMDQYIDTSQNLELHLECCKGLALIENYKMAVFPGSVHISEKIKGKINFSEILNNLDQFDTTGVHKKNIEELELIAPDPRKAIYKYIYFSMGADIPWFFAYYLRNQDFGQKNNNDQLNWNNEALQHFPKVVDYIEKLPFKVIGRVLFFTTYPNAGVTAHRDYHIQPHKDQNINLFFGGGWRPSFIWDDLNSKKIYLEKGSTSYFFNNRDYHGVDPEPFFRYTLRVDGIFEDWLQHELQLNDGWVWKE